MEKNSATATAFFSWRSIRTARVFKLRVVNQQSKGLGFSPTAILAKSILLLNSSSRVIRAPPMRSEWPPMYLVDECITASAPRSSGFWKYGEAKVLSTTENAPCSRALAVTLAMSVILRRGLVGDSMKMNFGFWLSAASRAVSSLKSTSSKSIPKLENTLVKRR